MARLTDLGFSKGIIAEIILSTYGTEGKPNGAPIGVVMKDEQHIIINFYNSSTSFKNIKEKKCAVVNLTSDIEVFYKTAFKEANLGNELPKGWFKKASNVNAPQLRFADASIEVSVTDVIPVDGKKTRVTFKINSIQAKLKHPQIYNRAFSQTLEAIIHATRVKVLTNDRKELNNVNRLLEKINECNKAVTKVAPNSSYSQIMTDLMKRVDLWQGKK